MFYLVIILSILLGLSLALNLITRRNAAEWRLNYHGAVDVVDELLGLTGKLSQHNRVLCHEVSNLKAELNTHIASLTLVLNENLKEV